MKAVWCVFLLCTVYLLLWPVSIEPVAWQAPVNRGFEGKFAQNTRLSELTLVDMGTDYGPEDFALNQNGTLATSSHSGAILLKKKGEGTFSPWVNTGGRPLGIEYDNKGNLLVADAHLGLLKIKVLHWIVLKVAVQPQFFGESGKSNFRSTMRVELYLQFKKC